MWDSLPLQGKFIVYWSPEHVCQLCQQSLSDHSLLCTMETQMLSLNMAAI